MRNLILTLVAAAVASLGSASARQTTYIVPSRFDVRIDFEVTNGDEALISPGEGQFVVVLCNTGNSEGQYSVASPAELHALRSGDCKLIPDAEMLSVHAIPGRWQGQAHVRPR